MNWRPRTFPGWLAILLLGTLTPAALAQNTTTGGLSGTIADNSGAALPGATVTAVHTPTGTRYQTVSGATGKYSLLNMRVGGPYAVSATLSGFKDWSRKDVFVKLGEEGIVNASLELGTLTEEVTVTAEVSLINPTSTGPAANVAKEAIESLPTIARGLEDFARVSPYFDAKGSGDGTDRPVLSVAGRNNRYNNIQIDGAVSNDLFAISDSSAPGNGSDGQPISLDAIQEIQLLVAPYDVRQGGFTGGGLNAITRSGANAFSGTAYYFFRNRTALTGDGPTHTPIAAVQRQAVGCQPRRADRAGQGVLLRERGHRAPPGAVRVFARRQLRQQTGATTDEVDRFLCILRLEVQLRSRAASRSSCATPTPTRCSARIDWNLAPNHQLTLRHNYLKGVTDRGFPSSRTYYMPDNWYQPHDKVHSSVAQLNSTFGTSVNEFRVTYQRIRTVADGPTRFPAGDRRPRRRFAGPRRAARTSRRQRARPGRLRADRRLHAASSGNHTITLGTHNEFFKFRNLFIRDTFGTYRFSSLDNFDAGLAQQYDRSFSLTGRSAAAARSSACISWASTPATVARALQLDAHLRRPRSTSRCSRTSRPPTRCPRSSSASPPTWCRARRWSPAPRLQLEPRRRRHASRCAAGSALLRPHALRLAVEPVRQHRHRVPAHRCQLQRRQPDSVRRRPRRPAPTVTGATGTAFQNEIDVVDPDYKYP